jgi:hypothetical protein
LRDSLTHEQHSRDDVGDLATLLLADNSGLRSFGGGEPLGAAVVPPLAECGARAVASTVTDLHR